MPDKRNLLEKLISQVSQGAEKISLATERTRQACIEAPGRMQTRYGSEKEEYGYLADGLNLRSRQMQRDLARLKCFRFEDNTCYVTEGSLVKVQTDVGIDDYLILPTNGGEVITIDEGEVTVMTTSAPLCNAMLGKWPGEDFYFELHGKKKVYRILSVS